MRALILAAFAAAWAIACSSSPEPAASIPSSDAASFATPNEAAFALIRAASYDDVPALLAILGPDGKDLVVSADRVQDERRATAFAAKAREKNAVELDPKDHNRATLVVGNDDWPLPIPIVKREGRWYFDTRAGRAELLRRRIGANELDAIGVCRGYVEAQKQYASTIHDGSGVNQYARRIISTPGTHDGLAWKNPDGSWGGPVGPAIARAIAEGYAERRPFHGYYFKVLKGQGPSARLGQLDYVIDGAMIGGFGLVAWPAEYGVTGVQTFIVSYDGVVYQKDLGQETPAIAAAMARYDPNESWMRTDDDW